jgi:hypothetical protein
MLCIQDLRLPLIYTWQGRGNMLDQCIQYLAAPVLAWSIRFKEACRQKGRLPRLAGNSKFKECSPVLRAHLERMAGSAPRGWGT